MLEIRGGMDRGVCVCLCLALIGQVASAALAMRCSVATFHNIPATTEASRNAVSNSRTKANFLFCAINQPM